MTALLLEGARVIDPAGGEDGQRDVLIVDGRLAAPKSATPTERRDVSGCWVFPALTDLRCVLRVQDDVADALAGGFARLIADPSSARGLKADGLELRFAAEVTRGTELGERALEAPCLSSGFAPIATNGLLRRALQHAERKVVMLHAEDVTLTAGAVVGEGTTALRLGLTGAPPESEVAAVAAALAVLEGTGGRLHFSHLTCRGSVERIAQAKRQGLSVTADATPHHLRDDDAKAEGYGLEARVWPPLRSRADVEAVKKAAIDGTLDAVATDHKRPSILEREHPFEMAAFGKLSLRTAFADVVAAGVPAARAVALFTVGPAAVLGLTPPSLGAGQGADLAVFDPQANRMRYTILQGASR
ncbi:MAG: amidohydrolase family protein [Myxococcaceae bacterium]|nr:amidohydrolase family protein [Myxococcaceae bacterium]